MQNHCDIPRHLITIPEVSRRGGISRRQIYQAIRQGDLEAYAIGGWLRVRETEFLRWLDSRRVKRSGVE